MCCYFCVIVAHHPHPTHPPVASEEEQWLTAITINNINNTSAGVRNQPHYLHYVRTIPPTGSCNSNHFIILWWWLREGGLAKLISLSWRVLFFLFVSSRFVFSCLSLTEGNHGNTDACTVAENALITTAPWQYVDFWSTALWFAFMPNLHFTIQCDHRQKLGHLEMGTWSGTTTGLTCIVFHGFLTQHSWLFIMELLWSPAPTKSLLCIKIGGVPL